MGLYEIFGTMVNSYVGGVLHFWSLDLHICHTCYLCVQPGLPKGIIIFHFQDVLQSQLPHHKVGGSLQHMDLAYWEWPLLQFHWISSISTHWIYYGFTPRMGPCANHQHKSAPVTKAWTSFPLKSSNNNLP